MNVLLTGATGFIGGRLLHALAAADHRVVVAGGRLPDGAPPGTRLVPVRFGAASSPADWEGALAGIEVAINAVGIFREGGADSGVTFDAVHVRGPRALFAACAAQGVRRVVQISALGADEGAATAYHLSKREADEALLALAAASEGRLEAVVVQPSLVFGTGGTSAGLFLSLAALPVLALPAGGRQEVQPVHIDDAVAALAALVEAPIGAPTAGHQELRRNDTDAARQAPDHSDQPDQAVRVEAGHVGPPASARRLPLVGPRPLTLAGYLQALRRTLGLPPAPVLAVPARLVGWAARLGDRIPGSLLDSASWSMLQRGNTGDPAPITMLLGRPPREAQEFVSPDDTAAQRLGAQFAWLRWLLRASLAAVWIVTAIVSAGVYPVAESLELLRRAGVPQALQPMALWGASALDLAFGVLTLWPLSAARARLLWLAQAALILGYTLIISVRLPEFWLHPYGPLTKNLPILAVLWLLHATEDPPAARDRR